MRIKFIHTMVISLALALTAACSGKPDNPSLPRVSEGKVLIELSGMEEGRPRFYTYSFEGGKVDYFAVLVDGAVESYFDACRKCSPSKKGFRFRNGKLLCKACGESYDTGKLQGTGSCHPIALKGIREGKHYAIAISDMMEGSKYF